jgi:hypothetical protein
MRGLLFIVSAIMVMGLGFWSYQENYKTRDAISDVRGLHAQIGAAHERLRVLQAEWAYLNRPDRLRDLAELNFDRLGLMPLMPDAFGDVANIIYPIPDILPITDPIDINAATFPQTDEDPL